MVVILGKEGVYGRFGVEGGYDLIYRLVVGLGIDGRGLGLK